MELTTRLEIKTGVFVPVRIVLDSSATDEQRAEWESIVRVTVSTGFKAGGVAPVQEVDPDYEEYQWYMAMKASSQPLFTYSGWLKAGKPAAFTGRSRGGCVR